jgi:hypothetical protein
MNVSDTQNSLFRQLDAAALVSTLQNAADQAQRQAALSHLREAQHRDASVQGLPGSDASLAVDGGAEEDDERRRQARRPASRAPHDGSPPLKDAPNPGPLGRHFDVTG